MSLADAKAVVLDARGFTEESGWTVVKVRVYWEKKVYDRLFQGRPDDYEVTPAEFLMGLGISLPERIRAMRMGQFKGSDVAYYIYKDTGDESEGKDE